MFILTKIIATLGPASNDLQSVVRLIEEGARVFRINFSHGGFEQFEGLLQTVRQASEKTGIPVGVLGDLSGPKIRVGRVREGGVVLEKGSRVAFQREPVVAGDTGQDIVFSTTYAQFIDEVQPGHRLLIDDGAVRMLVVEKTGRGNNERLICSVTVGGSVTSSKGVNLPDTDIAVPALTEYDDRCVDWAVRHGVDFLALSFVRRARDIHDLKSRLAQAARNPRNPTSAIPIVAKIEKPQALNDLEAIVQEADALMVARGDLGVEMELTMVPVIQKRIIALAHDYGKPVIVATQMLQSMIESAGPTRAEVSDVANAIYDGADAVMLSGETAVGKYPTQAVSVMGQIARNTEHDLVGRPSHDSRPPLRPQESRYRTAALAHGVNVVVRDLGAKLMGVWSQRGGGARYLSQNRPLIPIIAASSDPVVLRRMSLLYAVVPVLMDPPANLEDFASKIDRLIVDRKWASPGDQVVLVAGEPIGTPGVTNTLLIRQLGGICNLS